MDIAVGIGTVALQGLHVAFGALGVLVGLIALVMRKGRATHRAAGTLFVWCMGFTAFAAIFLAGRRIVSTPEDSIFWVTFGSVTLYMIATAAIAARRRDGHSSWGDWLAAVAMILVALAMMGWSADLMLSGQLGILPALFAFAAVGFAFGLSDFVRLVRRSRDPLARVTRHMVRALGALIGALTAFAIQNGDVFPPVVPLYAYWILPAALLVPVGLVYRIRIARSRLRVPGLVVVQTDEPVAEDVRSEPEFVEPAPPRERVRERERYAPPPPPEPEPEPAAPSFAAEAPTSEPERSELASIDEAPQPAVEETVHQVVWQQPAQSDTAPEVEVSWSDPASAEFPMKPEPEESGTPREEAASSHYWTEPQR